MASKAEEGAKECRICLEGELEIEDEDGPRNGNRLVRACKCTGSISYAHEKCLVQWIKRRIEQSYKVRARCEVCDGEFNYRVSHQRVFDTEEFMRNYSRDKVSFRAYFVLFSMMLLGWLGLVVVLIIASTNSAAGKMISGEIFQSSSVKVIYICSIFIYSVVILVVVLLFISEFAVRTEVKVRDVYEYVEKGMGGKAKNYKIYFRK